ncbi:oxygen-insensitive NADPH nitroreductase [Neocallimastix lanati (nom. inval.)]|nr:oxygen-insensitive NADPH nitroreductase [Neocallimastix sp. JGI-2020a]KAG4103590.1 oxygen-insensitive NADPH nitroreductase [Neocallimastix sp. JGI-2020a]
MNPVLESLFKHKSIRKYKDQPLEQEKLDLIIKAAQAAPNWCNAQHVSIIAVKDQAIKDKLSVWCNNQPYIASCPVFLVFCADFYRTSIIFEKNGDTKNTEELVQQLDNLFVGAHEVGIAMENAIVAAESMGLGTVCIGSIRRNCLDVVKELNLPKYVIPMIGLCVGYPDDNPGLKPRLPAKAVYFEDRYDTTHVKEAIDEFDDQYNKYLSSRDSNERDSNWSKSVYSIYTHLIGYYDDDFPMLKQQGYFPAEKK